MLVGGPAPILTRQEMMPEREPLAQQAPRQQIVPAVAGQAMQKYAGPNGRPPKEIGARGRKVDFWA